MKIIVALLLLLCGAWTFACEINPNEVIASLTKEPPAQVVKRLWDGEECERSLFVGLNSGQPEWIALAVALRPYTDAWSSESLQDSLGEAMQRAPSRVLLLVGGSSGFDERICLPWMLDDSGKSDNRYRQVIRRARTMFESFKGTKLEPQANICLAQVAIVERAPLFTEQHEH
jgi:hypothetical protein